MECANDAIDAEKELNLMYKCYNPILVICLFSEQLAAIGDAKTKFENDCL
jgi:hypothetical protein